MTMPNWFEWSKLILQLLTFLTAGVGLFFATRQLRFLVASYRDLHDWNRRKAAQDAIEKYRDVQEENLLLHDKFRVMESNDPIPLSDIQAECAGDAGVRTALHRRLNYFEALAVGCRQGVYDEDVVRVALEDMFGRSITQFKAYIDHRRGVGQKNVWREFEQLAEKWEAAREARPPRPLTGIVGGNNPTT